MILPAINIGSDRILIPLMQRLPNLYVDTSYYTVHRGIELLDSAVGAGTYFVQQRITLSGAWTGIDGVALQFD